MLRALLILVLLAPTADAEIVTLPHTPFCGDEPVFCFGKPGVCIGLVNNRGEVVKRFPRGFEVVGPFSEGLLAVADPSKGLTGYLDTEGEWALEPQWEVAYPFHSGRARFCEDDRCGFIDKSGEVVIEPRFGRFEREVEDFDSDGYARFYIGKRWDDATRRVGVIDRNGDVVLEPTYFALTEFTHGVAAAVLEGPCWQEKREAFDSGDYFRLYGGDQDLYKKHMWEGEESGVSHCRWRLIDTSGQPVSDSEFEDVWPFSEGLAAAREDERYGFIDRSGEWAIPPMTIVVPGPFSEGLAKVAAERLSYVDHDGRVVLTVPFEDARLRSPSSFHNGLAKLWILHEEDQRIGDGTVYFITRSGDLAFDNSFDQATDFCHGVARVEKRVGERLVNEALIDTSGKEIFDWPWF